MFSDKFWSWRSSMAVCPDNHSAAASLALYREPSRESRLAAGQSSGNQSVSVFPSFPRRFSFQPTDE